MFAWQIFQNVYKQNVNILNKTKTIRMNVKTGDAVMLEGKDIERG